MNNVKLRKKWAPSTTSFVLGSRLSDAQAALENALKPRAMVTVVHAVLYQDNVRVHYLLNGFHQKHCKISLQLLTDHVLEAYGSGKISDITAYYYIEENANSVSQSYLEAGKEIVEL